MTDAEDVEMNVESKKKSSKKEKKAKSEPTEETKEAKSDEPAFDPVAVTGAISIIANPLAVSSHAAARIGCARIELLREVVQTVRSRDVAALRLLPAGRQAVQEGVQACEERCVLNRAASVPPLRGMHAELRPRSCCRQIHPERRKGGCQGAAKGRERVRRSVVCAHWLQLAVVAG
jgi:hypothetical protein